MKTEQGYPAVAVVYEFDFENNTNTEHTFDTYQQALEYTRTNNGARVHFSPIFTQEVTR